jgi:hypothetical protein
VPLIFAPGDKDFALPFKVPLKVVAVIEPLLGFAVMLLLKEVVSVIVVVPALAPLNRRGKLPFVVRTV